MSSTDQVMACIRRKSRNDPGGHSALRAVLVLLAAGGIVAATDLAAQVLATPADSTLYSGDFGEVLKLAADHDARFIAGYYNDGKCRFAFRDTLTPIALYQRRDFGEAYAVRSWEPGHPDRIFTTTLYSRARNGFGDQITLEPGARDDADFPAGCRSRITLDRDDHVSDSFLGVRVVRTAHPVVYDIVPAGKTTRMLIVRRKPLSRGAGVWAVRTYSAAYSPAGYVCINWYDPPGTPQGGYVRETDLYPLPPPPAADPVD